MAFLLVLLLFLVVADVYIVARQSAMLRERERANARYTLELMGAAALESLLRNDYINLEQSIKHWGEDHPNILRLEALSSGGLVLGLYEAAARQRDEVFELTHPVQYEGRVLVTLRMSSDYSALSGVLSHLKRNLILVSALCVGVLGVVLWWLQERLSVEPLRQEVALRRQAEAELRAATERLTAANRELEAFAYSVSHDLRAPLMGIDGFSQALVEDYGDKLDDQARRYVDRIRAGTQRMERLISDMLKLSRLSRTDLRPLEVDLTALARDVAAGLREAHPGRKVEFLAEEGLRAQADPALLTQVFENLLGNAWKFTSATEVARIELSRAPASQAEPGYEAFCLRDNGAGFEMKYAGRLFGAFQRLHSEKQFAGNGIGLATVQRILARHGGSIRAEAEPGKGAAFYFTLPRAGGAIRTIETGGNREVA